MRVLLLAALMTGIHSKDWVAPCECIYGDSLIGCSCSKATVELMEYWQDVDSSELELKITCKDANIACSDLPQLNITTTVPVLLMLSGCSPSVLKCVTYVIDEPLITAAELNITGEPLTLENLGNLDKVTALHIILADDETFTKGNMTAFSSLPSLSDLTIEHGKLQLSPHMFSQTPALETLALLNSKISSFPVDVFIGLANLKTLFITGSNIENISADALRGLDILEKIHLDGDNIQNIEAGAIPTLSKLTYITIRNHQLETFPNGMLEGMEELKYILVNNNQLELTLGSRAFANLPALESIQLDRNNIRLLPENLFKGCFNLKEIVIELNLFDKLPSQIFLGLSSLMIISLRGNEIEKLPEGIFNYLYKLEYLDLSENNIEILSPLIFNDLSNLKNLKLNDNKIREFGLKWSLTKISDDPDRFHIVSDRLDYKYKATHSLTDGFWDEQPISSFYSMKQLNSLDLSGNQLAKFYQDWLFEMPKIEIIDLSRNQLTNIQDFNANFSGHNIIIDLQYNEITDVVLDPRNSPAKDEQAVKSYLILENNPINCDCHSYGLYRRLNGAKATEEPVFVMLNSFCSTPSEFEEKHLKDLSPNQLVCAFPEPCPNNCSSCIVKAATNEIIMKCSKLPYTLPDQKSINLRHSLYEEPTITLDLDDQPRSIEGLNINTLNLSNTGIHNIAFRPTDSLKILDVSHNNLNIIPDEFFKANITLYLSDNPFECDCSFTSALHEYDLIADLDQVTCANGDKIAQISVAQLCNWKHTLIARIGTSIVCSFFFIMVGITLYKKYSRICCINISKNLGRRLSDASITLEGKLFAVKQFDLFISFAHQDLDFVTGNLLPKLEKDFKQKVCVHYRDWTVGDLIPDQIIKSVDSSRRTIIILTENFLSSEWSYLEFQTAHNLSIQEGRPRVILILLKEETSRDVRLGNDLKSYISLNTYLLWGDPNFWDKLKKILPKQVRK